MNGFVNPRWALDMVVVSSEQKVQGQDQDKKDIQFYESISMDDENSPGVFHVSDSVHCQVDKNEILHPSICNTASEGNTAVLHIQYIYCSYLSWLSLYFQLDEITTRECRDQKGGGGYVQWRPVSYLNNELDINDATEPNLDTLGPLPKPEPQPLRASLAYVVLGEEMFMEMLSLASTTVSFGLPGDGFYTESNFTTWLVSHWLSC